MTTKTIYTKHDIDYLNEHIDDLVQELRSTHEKVRTLCAEVYTLRAQHKEQARQISDALGYARCVQSYLNRMTLGDSKDDPSSVDDATLLRWATDSMENAIMCLSRR